VSKGNKLGYGLMFIGIVGGYLVSGTWGWVFALIFMVVGIGLLFSAHSRGLGDSVESEILSLPHETPKPKEAPPHAAQIGRRENQELWMELFREKQRLEQELIPLEKQLPPLPHIHLMQIAPTGQRCCGDCTRKDRTKEKSDKRNRGKDAANYLGRTLQFTNFVCASAGRAGPEARAAAGGESHSKEGVWIRHG
jgi:hypothetical protein